MTTRALREYHVPVLADLPRDRGAVRSSTFDPFGPHGAKPMSEAPFNPVAPALANAVRDATGVRLTALPLRRDGVYGALCTEPPTTSEPATESGGVTMVQLGANRYGKAEVRVVRVARGAGHDGEDVIRDWNVSTSLSGDLDGTHLTGDNSNVLPTDSQKNRVYALAKELGAVEPETFALELGVVLRRPPRSRSPGRGSRSRSTAGRRSARPGTRSPGPATWCGRRPWCTTPPPGPRWCRGSRT